MSFDYGSLWGAMLMSLRACAILVKVGKTVIIFKAVCGPKLIKTWAM